MNEDPAVDESTDSSDFMSPAPDELRDIGISSVDAGTACGLSRGGSNEAGSLAPLENGAGIETGSIVLPLPWDKESEDVTG